LPVVVAILLAPGVRGAEIFPFVRPATRAQAVSALTGGAESPVPCLTPLVQSLLEDPRSGSPAARRALGVLQNGAHLFGERRWVEQDGTIVRYTLHRVTFDRIDATDEDRNGRPDLVDAVIAGVADARRVLVGQFGLPAPDPVEVFLGKIGGDLDGFTIPASGTDGRPLLVIDASPSGGAAAARAAAIHQYSHAVALVSGSGAPAAWGEALATWAEVRVSRGPDARIAALFAERIERMHEGLDTELLGLAAGNALWLAFLEEAYGPIALRLAVEEISSGLPAAVAFDQALRRAGEESLASAFREFQIWTLLVGERSNGMHFSFADRLATPRFASESDGLPALSVQADPAVGPLGAAAVRLRPEESRGGLAIRFEGDTPGRWEADVLLVLSDGSLHRLPVPLAAEGRGDLAIPLTDIAATVLLVRNLDPDPSPARPYAWSAHAVPGYPFEVASLEATAGEDGGAVVTWDTTTESGLVGFNVLRREEGADATERVNPLWIPALGDEETPASYQFVDDTANPGSSYTYRIEGITETGLASVSEPVVPTRRPQKR
jgi:hypothetical protein